MNHKVPAHVAKKMAEVKELLSFLSAGARLDIKCTALEYILGLTGSEDGREWIKANGAVLERLLDLLEDKNEVISKDAHLAIVNLSADRSIVESLVDHMPQLLCYLKQPQWTHADKICTILSNLSRDARGAGLLFEALTDAETGGKPGGEGGKRNPTLCELVDIFDRWDSFNKRANFHYLASVFLNLSQLGDARQLFLDRSKCILPKLLPYTQFPESHIRRGGIVGLIKNICFEVGT